MAICIPSSRRGCGPVWDFIEPLHKFWEECFCRTLDLGYLPEEFNAVVERLMDDLTWGDHG